MSAVRGRVRGGHIETDATLPEGTEVVVLMSGDEEPFELEDAQVAELETRMTEADRRRGRACTSGARQTSPRAMKEPFAIVFQHRATTESPYP